MSSAQDASSLCGPAPQLGSQYHLIAQKQRMPIIALSVEILINPVQTWTSFTNFELTMRLSWRISRETFKGRSFESTTPLINPKYRGNCTEKNFQSAHTPRETQNCSNEPKLSQIHSLRKCTELTGECSTYQLSIKLIRDENPFDIQANVFCLGTQHIFCIEGSHARNKEQAPKLNLSLYIVPSHLLVTPKRYFMQATWSYIQIFVI